MGDDVTESDSDSEDSEESSDYSDSDYSNASQDYTNNMFRSNKIKQEFPDYYLPEFHNNPQVSMDSILNYTNQYKQEIGSFNFEKIAGFPPLEMEKQEDRAGNDYAISEVSNESIGVYEEDITESDDESDSEDTDETYEED